MSQCKYFKTLSTFARTTRKQTGDYDERVAPFLLPVSPSAQVYLLVLSVTTLSLLLAPVLWRISMHKWVHPGQRKTITWSHPPLITGTRQEESSSPFPKGSNLWAKGTIALLFAADVFRTFPTLFTSPLPTCGGTFKLISTFQTPVLLFLNGTNARHRYDQTILFP